MKVKNIYCDQDELHKAIEEYYEEDSLNIKNGGSGVRIPDKIGHMIEDIAKGAMSAGCFNGYPMNDEMVRCCVAKMSEVIGCKKFDLFGKRSEPVRSVVVKKGFSLPDMDLKEDQKFVLQQADNNHTLVVFKQMYGFKINVGGEISYVSNTKELENQGYLPDVEDFTGEVIFNEYLLQEEMVEDHKYTARTKGKPRKKFNSLKDLKNFKHKYWSGVLNNMNFDEDYEIEGTIFTKIHMYNSNGDYAYEKDYSYKRDKKCDSTDPQVRSFSLIDDDEKTIQVEACNTLRVEYNGKRRLEMQPVFFDKFSKLPSMQKNNAFAYLSKCCNYEGLREVNMYKRRRETLDKHQSDQWSDILSQNPQMKDPRLDHDTYNDWDESKAN